MSDAVLNILAVLGACAAVLALGAFLYCDVMCLIEWRRAERCQGAVLEYLGPMVRYGYGRGSKRTWHRYRVRLDADGRECEAVCREAGLGAGSRFEVRYCYGRNGALTVLDPSFVARIRTFLVCFPLGVLWGIAAWWFTSRG